MAAKLAVVDYDKKNLEPILSVEEAFEKCSFYEVPPLLNPEPVGAFSKGMAKSDHQMLSAEVIIILHCCSSLMLTGFRCEFQIFYVQKSMRVPYVCMLVKQIIDRTWQISFCEVSNSDFIEISRV
ncbi:hypothetical protein ES319_D03G016800v1 [Gossypium barbadense]|uniref:Uncharacterized protein n=1 Tax=Gossypium barbadense TaxID=3634 RepID=A0A5J5S035_GOSBA|nr:hypothetical protein ES319_D03G016800v1 [Gossypium barbadense]